MLKIRLMGLLVSGFLCFGHLQAQSPPEIVWAIFHPFAALRVKTITQRCQPYFQYYKAKGRPDGFENGGRLDAFRHTFFMAAFAQKIKPAKLLKLGEAHEKGNYKDFRRAKLEEGELADFLSCEMDLINNELGVKLGRAKRYIPLDSLAILSLKLIEEGYAVIMKRNQAGYYLNCKDEQLDLKIYEGHWMVPKCLTNSGFIKND